jgi:hypothetical protein
MRVNIFKVSITVILNADTYMRVTEIDRKLKDKNGGTKRARLNSEWRTSKAIP